MKKKLLLLIILLACATHSCNRRHTYTIATLSKGTTYHTNGTAVSRVLGKIGIDLSVTSGKELGSYVNCQKLWDGEVDFAIAQNYININDFMNGNDTDTDLKVRTVLPLYPEILYIIYPAPKKREPGTDAERHNEKNQSPVYDGAEGLIRLVRGKRIGVGPTDSGTSRFLDKLLAKLGMEPSQYTFVHTPWHENILSSQIDVSVTIAGYNAPNVNKMLTAGNCRLFSFASPVPGIAFTAAQGLCMNFPGARPFTIAANSYGLLPHRPIATLAFDALLLCRKEIKPLVVYNILEEIFKQKALLAYYDPLLSGLNEDFSRGPVPCGGDSPLNAGSLSGASLALWEGSPSHTAGAPFNFPLHQGSLRYLDKSVPTFFERYAESIGVLFSILITIIGASISLVKWRSSVKKERLDVYFQKVLDIERELEAPVESPVELLKYRASVKALIGVKQEVVGLLMEEKLEGNQGFNVLLTFIDNLVLRIERKEDNARHPAR
ncbi:MAG: hypothetical protein GY765_19430 [bacterium]|nr:hypothetical protein [bacterium]